MSFGIVAVSSPRRRTLATDKVMVLIQECPVKGFQRRATMLSKLSGPLTLFDEMHSLLSFFRWTCPCSHGSLDYC